MDGTPEELTKAIVDEIEALIVKEVGKFADFLMDEIRLTPPRADMNVNQHDLQETVRLALTRYRTSR